MRYRLDSGPPLGTGGWCVVRRAEDTLAGGRPVAVKTFGAQAARELGPEALLARFRREIQTFEAIAVAPNSPSSPPEGPDPREFFVNLLDFSRSSGGVDQPGPAADGQLYTVLELADDSLHTWLERRSKAKNFVGLEELKHVASSLAQGLAWLHKIGMCHLDIKPENMMLFGSQWKLIDLEGCLPAGVGQVPQGSFTPLYACPELAQFALREISEGKNAQGPSPSGLMDSWATGIVLLDILAHAACLQETKAGFDSAALFEEEAIPFESWYRWLASSEQLDPSSFLEGMPPGGKDGGAIGNLRKSPELQGLVQKLLQKDPKLRMSADEMLAHPLLAVPKKPKEPQGAVTPRRDKVEGVFQKWESGDRSRSALLARNVFRELLMQVGLTKREAEVLLEAKPGVVCVIMHRNSWTFSMQTELLTIFCSLGFGRFGASCFLHASMQACLGTR
ncbi:unnamed protein product [Polarella glacialis]|uniref:Protein kinase domain-containing protein n=1 Tax=Polarella glacialis TaxID=89957 RepID=A0A813LG81_POLGL|nr:unnamed protein product [Polarella glacialis]